MIIKSFELNKIDLKKNNFFLFYGENEGLKKEIIESNFKNNYPKKTFYYDESEVLNNKVIFLRKFYQNPFLKMKN